MVDTNPSKSAPLGGAHRTLTIGGKEKNKHANKKLRAGRGAVGKATVAGVRDRGSKRVSAAVVEATDKATLQGRCCMDQTIVASRPYP